MGECKQCGTCCVNNGLIPPLLPRFCEGEDAGAPAWLKQLVHALRRDFASVSEEYQCVFLTDDKRCAIHEHKPAVCRDFHCDEE